MGDVTCDLIPAFSHFSHCSSSEAKSYHSQYYYKVHDLCDTFFRKSRREPWKGCGGLMWLTVGVQTSVNIYWGVVKTVMVLHSHVLQPVLSGDIQLEIQTVLHYTSNFCGFWLNINAKTMSSSNTSSISYGGTTSQLRLLWTMLIHYA